MVQAALRMDCNVGAIRGKCRRILFMDYYWRCILCRYWLSLDTYQAICRRMARNAAVTIRRRDSRDLCAKSKLLGLCQQDEVLRTAMDDYVANFHPLYDCASSGTNAGRFGLSAEPKKVHVYHFPCNGGANEEGIK